MTINPGFAGFTPYLSMLSDKTKVLSLFDLCVGGALNWSSGHIDFIPKFHFISKQKNQIYHFSITNLPTLISFNIVTSITGTTMSTQIISVG